mmetsp:Transcript_59614/g.132753  ORF Transcript_59614/g.132753 Transcript_59614/m.132753 type:complete len:217 (+) Transcript_59614:845-1495(+)
MLPSLVETTTDPGLPPVWNLSTLQRAIFPADLPAPNLRSPPSGKQPANDDAAAESPRVPDEGPDVGPHAKVRISYSSAAEAKRSGRFVQIRLQINPSAASRSSAHSARVAGSLSPRTRTSTQGSSGRSTLPPLPLLPHPPSSQCTVPRSMARAARAYREEAIPSGGRMAEENINRHMFSPRTNPQWKDPPIPTGIFTPRPTKKHPSYPVACGGAHQ